MGLITDVLLVLVGIDQVVLREEFRYHFASVVPFLFELFSSFWCGGVHSKDKGLLLICVGEGVQVLFFVIEMASVSYPSGFWDLVVEES